MTKKKRGPYKNRKYDPNATTRICRICGREKDVSSFNPNRLNKHGVVRIESRCHLCMRTLKYGISSTEYEARLIAQDYKCAVCKEPLPEKHDIDHCHDTNIVRGILCPPCNVMIGYARNDVVILQGAIDYLSNPVTL